MAEEKIYGRNVAVFQDVDGNNIALIKDIIFKGKRNVQWKDVEDYLKYYIGEFFTIAETNEIVYFGKDLPDEYAHSEYTSTLKGANAKAKANASHGIVMSQDLHFQCMIIKGI